MKKVLLAQTDTTVGFLSKNSDALIRVKERPSHKQFLKVYAQWKTFKADGGRIPKAQRSYLRRAEKTTFIIKGNAYRVVNSGEHHNLLRPYGWLYSTSANQSGKEYERSFCEASADIIVEDFRGFKESLPSSIELLGKRKRRKLR
ncbi:MAG: hypothetical protein U9Q62_11085 [Campylobacterota bacterium]|nr:hypothetical protein [Campylobacterota bacterium]